jgi:hypothetical protein
MEDIRVMPGLVPGIHPTTGAGPNGPMDPGDKHRDDRRDASASKSSKPALLMGREP